MLTRRSFAGLAAGAAVASRLGGGTGGAWAAGAIRPVVVEMFTSQGCSSSPPADALLGEISQRPDVIALSLNVDYWDYLGWRDTLGSADCARRQRDYAARRGDGDVYTPQAVINGVEDVLGSDRSGLSAAIARAKLRQAADVVPIRLISNAREIDIEIAAAAAGAPRREATIWVATVVPQTVVDIERGENSGRTVTYTNAVRKLVPAGMWHGSETRLSLPRSAVMGEGTVCYALLQVDGTGPIIGAARPDTGT